MSRKALVPIQLPADPTQALEAVTKQYVDGRVPEVNVSTAGPSPRTSQLLWVDTDDTLPGVVGQRWSPEFTDLSASMAPNGQAVGATITHGLGVKPSLIVGHLEDGSWAHQCTWRMSILNTTQVQVTYYNGGANTAQALLRFRLLY